MNPSLLQVRDILSDPKRWTRGVSARDAKGGLTGAHDPDAVCWCLYGAMNYIGVGPREWDIVMSIIRRKHHRISISEFNDDDKTRHEDVLEVIDLALKEAA